MKLIYCPTCQDMMKLDYTLRTCKCGLSSGKYEKDGINAIINQHAIPVCIGWTSFNKALNNIPLNENISGICDNEFNAWIPPINCKTIKVEYEENNNESKRTST